MSEINRVTLRESVKAKCRELEVHFNQQSSASKDDDCGAWPTPEPDVGIYLYEAAEFATRAAATTPDPAAHIAAVARLKAFVGASMDRLCEAANDPCMRERTFASLVIEVADKVSAALADPALPVS